MIGASVEIEGASARTAEAFARLIQQRSEAFHTSMRDAAVATVINALSSLRSGTKVAKNPVKDLFISRIRADLFPAYYIDGDYRRRCLRQGFAHGPRVNDGLPLRIYNNDKDSFARWLVFEIRAKSAAFNFKPYYIVAPSERAAVEYQWKRQKQRVEQFGGLAKFLIAKAAAKLSTRSPGSAPSAAAAAVADKNATVSTDISGDLATTTVIDSLSYAKLALQSGMSVNLAMQRAANRTVGIINASLKRQGRLDETFPTPFPEISRSRRK